jgi:GNAT superfamily N-acetyltransferase
MKFIDYNTYLFESEDSKTVSKKDKIETEYGWIDYYYEVSDEYPNGVVVDLGGYVHKEYRGQGKLKEMLKELLSSVPEGTTVHMAVANRKLLPMFRRLGFKQVKRIAYWGEVSHAMEAIVTPELIDNI